MSLVPLFARNYYIFARGIHTLYRIYDRGSELACVVSSTRVSAVPGAGLRQDHQAGRQGHCQVLCQVVFQAVYQCLLVAAA